MLSYDYEHSEQYTQKIYDVIICIIFFINKLAGEYWTKIFCNLVNLKKNNHLFNIN